MKKTDSAVTSVIVKGISMKKISFMDDWVFYNNDGDGTLISLPHDAMLVEGRTADAKTGSGGAFFKGGVYRYEKKFWASEDWKEQEIILEFEGVYPNAVVYLNGVKITSSRSGYTFFRVKLTTLHYNAFNELSVSVDNSNIPNSRWYTGAGLYRPVWMWIGNKNHIEPDGIRITTLDYQKANVMIDVLHNFDDLKNKKCQIEIFWLSEKIAEGSGFNSILTMEQPKLWSAESPNLYQCIVTIMDNDDVVDRAMTNFGIRSIEWSTKGLYINGKETLLQGGCIHHDNGILGARSFEESEWRRIRLLKNHGFNAIRSSHYPLCKSALDACDALGIYVMDETWDMWNISKTKYDFANVFIEEYEKDLDAIVAKDFNHPSVIMYSIGNEVSEPATENGMELAAKIFTKLKSLDKTRPITAGINLTILLMSTMNMNAQGSGSAPESKHMSSTEYNKMVSEMGNRMLMAAATEGADMVSSPILDLLDIAGYNYATSRYEMEGEKHPDRIIVGSETYTYELAENWEKVMSIPYVIGDFMWTAWDYLGEVGIGSWSYDDEDISFEKNYPWILSGAGAIDILGNPGAMAGMAEVVWDKRSTPFIAVRPVNHPGITPNKGIWSGSNAMPYWSYNGCDGNEAAIEVYSKAYEIRLYINGRLIGAEKPLKCKTLFTAPYEQGELKAIAYDESGNVLNESILKSAEGNTKISIAQDCMTYSDELLYFDISLTGENNEIECNRDTQLSVSVLNGELLAFGSANPKTTQTYITGQFKTYYGRSQAVVKRNGNPLMIKVEGEGLQTVSKIIKF